MASNQVNGPAGMYKVNPYYDSTIPVKLPDCMYNAKSYYENSNLDLKTAPADLQESSPEVKALEQWQESILSRLGALKGEVDKMVSASGISAQSVAEEVNKIAAASKSSSRERSVPKTSVTPTQSAAVTTAKKPQTPSDVIQDLVINANPSSPPLSLLVLYQLLCDQQKVLASSLVHSSAGPVSDKLRSLFQRKGDIGDRSLYKVAFTLVWKDESFGPSLMVNPTVQTLIQGEANVARYLARLLKPAYDDTDIVKATEIDNLVDMASTLNKGNNKERAAVLRTLNAKLGKSAWLVGGEVTLADILLWGAIMQTGQSEGAPGNVKKWLERCAEQDAFKFALQAI